MTILDAEKRQGEKRVNRLFFLHHLKSEYGIIITDKRNIKALADKWQVSTRTIRRDIADVNKIHRRSGL